MAEIHIDELTFDPDTFCHSSWLPANSLIGKQVFMLSCVEVGDRQMVVLMDNMSFIPSKETFDEIVSTCYEFYDVASTQAIDEYNQSSLSWRYSYSSEQSQPQERDNSGFVYLLKSGDHYKIGMSRNADKRMTEISPKLPIEPTLIHTIKTQDMYELESNFHEYFADKRTNGEWFLLSESDVEWIKGFPHAQQCTVCGEMHIEGQGFWNADCLLAFNFGPPKE